MTKKPTSKRKVRPPFLWDKKLIKLAKQVGKYIREQEAERVCNCYKLTK